jgi:glycosyltransferase involved in cell wall biosynthesis
LKVLVVSPSYEPIVGGTETFVLKLVTTLNKLGVHTDVMTFNMNQKWKPYWRKTTIKKQFTIHKIPGIANPLAFLPINPLHSISRVNVFPHLGFTKLFNDYDVIHFCDEEDLSFPLFSLLIKKPKIMHSLTPKTFETISQNLFQRKIYKHIAQIYIPCSFQIETYLKIGIPQSKIIDKKSVGVNADIFTPNESKRVDSLILFIGRLQKIKGVHILLDSLQYVKNPVQVVIIGPFDQNDPKYSEELKKSVEQVNAQGKHKVELLGRKNEEELIPWYQKATLLAAPHIDQICGGLTTLEALACATPVIATGDEVIKDEINGLLIPPNDAEKLANAMNRLLENKELRRKYGNKGRQIIEEQYSWNIIAKDMIKTYQTLLKTPPS